MLGMTGSVDVLVVGGGVIGLSVARELIRAGVDDVAVLERHAAVGQESSSRANGGFRAQFTTRPNIEFSRWSIDEFERLEAQTGLLSMHRSGYLLITGNEESERDLRAAVELQRSLGVTTEWLAPEAIIERAPFVRPDGLRAGTFHARDGFLDPYGVVRALELEARRLGVRIETRTTVHHIGRSADGAFLVEHPRSAPGSHSSRTCPSIPSDAGRGCIQRRPITTRSSGRRRDSRASSSAWGSAGMASCTRPPPDARSRSS
jgi:glycine/D-amino acid oxidase-like deaminating enzyme